MGDGCGSGTGLDPDSIFYCASLSLYFMFPALLHRADAGDGQWQRTTPATGAIFFLTRKRVREGGGGRGGTVGGSEGWDDG